MSEFAQVSFEYVNFVMSRVKSGQTILSSLTKEKCHLLHMSMKLASEAGELSDVVGKHVFYNQKLDIATVREELGDILFYYSGISSALALPLSYIMAKNIQKLKIRYPQGYSDKDALERKDKR